jgi:uncharacterized Fe-S cluster-containing MiaB family protein
MFMDKVVTKIWEQAQLEYDQAYNDAKQMSTHQLVNRLTQLKMTYYKYPGVMMNGLPTCGCPHRFSNGKISGCSMCNYHSIGISLIASLAVLREKDVKLYSETIKQIFINQRGVRTEPDLVEFISGNDSCNEQEYPEELYKELFGSGELFKIRPFRYLFETRASSITPEAMERMRKYLTKRSKIVVEFGTEVSSEWLRNHWINKNILDSHIKKGVAVLHHAGLKAHTDVLIGIPGITERQSLKLFKETILILDQWGVDEFVCLPLNRKNYTLQGYLYHQLRDNEILDNIGLAQGEHTGLPWLFTIIEALGSVLEEQSELINRLNLAQIIAETNSVPNETSFNKDRECLCNNMIIEVLQMIRRNVKNTDLLLEVRDTVRKDPCYEDYLKLIEKQEKAGDIKETLTTVATEIAKTMWPENWNEYIDKFKEELRSFDYH